MRRPPTALSAVVLVLAATAAVLLTRPAAPSTPAAPPSVGRLVSSTALACPDQPPGSGVSTTLRVGLAPGLPGVHRSGTVETGPVSGGSTARALSRGSLVTVPADGGPEARATGAAAAGLFGARTERVPGKAVAVTPCVAARAQWWFTGAGAGLDHSSTLMLANLDPGPAVVDLRVLGPDGDVATVATTGIVVAPHTVRRFALADLAPQTDDLALSVKAERGRVAASVTDAFRQRATAPAGREWLSASEQPSRDLTVSGLPVKAQRRTLLVANPSELEAVLDVRVAGRSGTFTPTGLGEVTVGPRAILPVDLTGLLPTGEPVAVRVTSRTPVLATVRSVDPTDTSDAGAADPLTGPAAAVLVPGTTASVQLTAGRSRAHVGLTSYTASGRRVRSARLTMSPTATAAWSPGAGAAYVVVSPRGSGSVRGAVSYAGSGVASVPLSALPARELRPRVVPGLR